MLAIQLCIINFCFNIFLMALFCTAFKRDTVSLLRFSFFNYVQVFLCAISPGCHLKYTYIFFSWFILKWSPFPSLEIWGKGRFFLTSYSTYWFERCFFTISAVLISMIFCISERGWFPGIFFNVCFTILNLCWHSYYNNGNNGCV